MDRKNASLALPEEAKAKVEEAARAAASVPKEKNAVFVSVTQAFENGLQIGKMLQDHKELVG